MRLMAYKNNEFLNFINNIKSENLGLYFSFIIHFVLLLSAIGLPNFFEPKPIIVPNIIPIEIVNVSDITSIPKKIKEKELGEKKPVQVEEKKFNSSENQEIKKIEIKDKVEVNKTKEEKKIKIKDNVVIKEKKDLPKELIKEKIKIQTNENFESVPTKKIKPKLKPQLNQDNVKKKINTDLSAKVEPRPKPKEEFSIASMLKDLRNEKSTPKIENENKKDTKNPLDKTENEEVAEDAQLSISEIDLVLQQLSKCFIAPAGAKINKNMYVKISAKIQQNRRVLDNSIRIVDTNIRKSSSVYGPITESAMRTLLNPECIPLELPEDKYDLWKNLTMTFDYSVMRGS